MRAGAQIKTAAVTAAITGTTIMLEYHPDAYIKFIILEGTGRIFRNDRVGESVLVHAGQMLIVNPKGKTLPDPVDVDLDRLRKTSALLSRDFAPLPSEISSRRRSRCRSRKKAENALLDTNLVIFGGGTAVSLIEATATIDQRIAVTETTARESPSPTPRSDSFPNSDAHVRHLLPRRAQHLPLRHRAQRPPPTPTPSPTPSRPYSHAQSTTPTPTPSATPTPTPTATPSPTPTPTITPNSLSDDHPHTNSHHHSATGGLGHL